MQLIYRYYLPLHMARIDMTIMRVNHGLEPTNAAIKEVLKLCP